MIVLSFSITVSTETDLNGVAEDTKTYCAMFNGNHHQDCWVELATVPEADAKTAFKASLTSLGHTWDYEV